MVATGPRPAPVLPAAADDRAHAEEEDRERERPGGGRVRPAERGDERLREQAPRVDGPEARHRDRARQGDEPAVRVMTLVSSSAGAALTPARRARRTPCRWPRSRTAPASCRTRARRRARTSAADPAHREQHERRARLVHVVPRRLAPERAAGGVGERRRPARPRACRSRSWTRSLPPRQAWNPPSAAMRARLQSAQKFSVIAPMKPTSPSRPSRSRPRMCRAGPQPRQRSGVRATPSASSRRAHLGERHHLAASERHLLDEARERAAIPCVPHERRRARPRSRPA